KHVSVGGHTILIVGGISYERATHSRLIYQGDGRVVGREDFSCVNRLSGNDHGIGRIHTPRGPIVLAERLVRGQGRRGRREKVSGYVAQLIVQYAEISQRTRTAVLDADAIAEGRQLIIGPRSERNFAKGAALISQL